jgi:hypothetical protein
MSSRKKKIIGALLTAGVLLATMIDRVHETDGHLSFLVLAPYPTFFEFDHSAGESIKAWQSKNPGKPLPWWIKGHYIVLIEVTDS